MDLAALLVYARPYRSRLALVVVISLLGSLAGLAIPWLAGQLLGGIIESGSIAVVTITLLLVAALLVLTSLTFASALVSAVVANRIQADFRRDIYAHMQRLPLTFFDQSRQGDLLALMTWEVSRLSAFISGTLTAVPAALLTGVGALAVLFAIDPLLAALIPLLVPAYYLTLKLIGRRLRSLAQRVQEAEAGIFATAEEDLEMLPAIKSFAREDMRLAAYTQRLEEARDLSVREAGIYALLAPAMSLVTALAAIALILLAGQSVADGGMTPTDLFSFMLYAALLTRPVGALANLYGQLQTAKGTLARLQRVLAEGEEPGYAAQGRLERCRGEIAFRDVWFSYPGRHGTLQGVTVEIAQGEVIALTGENGSGKSTLVNLLLGFYQPERGEIALDGVDIAKLDVRNLRDAIGYVPQRPLLFNGSVRENIAFSLEGVTQANIEKAACLAQALPFIKGLPSGFETQIGDHGVRLSGGQRQRIALARALLKDPPILILDEATSMYDLEGEAAFVEACKTALFGRTVIIITHRPASLALADRTIHLANGSIAEVNGEPARKDGL
ncbi:ATP-binding cassette domain-containing protein [Porphyrobacter sp. SLTP]|uniref:ABC transporter ATP-binding protein n=1 Tax=Porphyrobacter sp. SLTP TaxID=2683266 RepID=UPI001411D83E|nr:ABC transporter ATP-binding protein [Porphyrobacter sp. SLTP]NBB23604.1 ATP-binding cassette domain-containing protein [Porphyrobacter sp. SLTP]